MTAAHDFRVGDWVSPKDDPGLSMRVESVHGSRIKAAGDTWVWVALVHCAPDPLPDRLPVGARTTHSTLVRFERRDGARYWGDFKQDNGELLTGVWCNFQDLDIGAYWSALHREQDEAQMKRQPIGHADELSEDERIARTVPCPYQHYPNRPESRCLAGIGEPCRDCNDRSVVRKCGAHGERLEAARSAKLSPPSPYVPVAGEVVVVEEILSCDSGKPYFEQLVGRAVKVTDVRPPEGPWSILIWIEGATEWMYCRVRRLRSVIDVECPLCKSAVGARCVYVAWYKTGQDLPVGQRHAQREKLFFELTKGSSPNEGGTAGTAGSMAPSPGAGTAIAGRPGTAESADSVGTGRAAGTDPHMATNKGVRGEPAAPSGFRAPQFMFDVECEACGASGPKAKRGHYCVDSEGVPTLEFHALRVSAFEARRERKEEPKPEPLPKCSNQECGQEIRMPARSGVIFTESAKRSGRCIDCYVFHDVKTVSRPEPPAPPPHPWSDEANWYWSHT